MGLSLFGLRASSFSSCLSYLLLFTLLLQLLFLFFFTDACHHTHRPKGLSLQVFCFCWTLPCWVVATSCVRMSVVSAESLLYPSEHPHVYTSSVSLSFYLLLSPSPSFSLSLSLFLSFFLSLLSQRASYILKVMPEAWCSRSIKHSPKADAGVSTPPRCWRWGSLSMSTTRHNADSTSILAVSL